MGRAVRTRKRQWDRFPVLVFSIILCTGIIATLIISWLYISPKTDLPSTTLTGRGYNTVAEVPAGFAAPRDIDNGQVFLTAAAQTSGTTLSVRVAVTQGSNIERQYVYKTGYISKGGSWVQFNFSNTTVGTSKWILGEASGQFEYGTVPATAREEHVIVYVCKKYPALPSFYCGAAGLGNPTLTAWTIQNYTAGGTGCTSDCTVTGAKRCHPTDAATIQECQMGTTGCRQWTNSTICTGTNEVCVDLECTAVQLCSSGANQTCSTTTVTNATPNSSGTCAPNTPTRTCYKCNSGYFLSGSQCLPVSTPTCAAGQSCAGGVCACTSGSSCLSGQCAANCQATNVEFCAANGSVTGATAVTPAKYCAGTDTCLACGTNTIRCTNIATSACVNNATDNNNCGTCNKACSNGKTCQAGLCKCPSGQTDCSGVCKNMQTDTLNCGTCGHSCGTGQTCTSGTCTCTGGTPPCGNTCCPAGQSCNSLGSCTTPQTCTQNCNKDRVCNPSCGTGGCAADPDVTAQTACTKTTCGSLTCSSCTGKSNLITLSWEGETANTPQFKMCCAATDQCAEIDEAKYYGTGAQCHNRGSVWTAGSGQNFACNLGGSTPNKWMKCGGTGQPSCTAPVCTPKTCNHADYIGKCGTGLSDGCGGTINCTCASGTCSTSVAGQTGTCAQQCGTKGALQCTSGTPCNAGYPCDGNSPSNGWCWDYCTTCPTKDSYFIENGLNRETPTGQRWTCVPTPNTWTICGKSNQIWCTSPALASTGLSCDTSGAATIVQYKNIKSGTDWDTRVATINYGLCCASAQCASTAGCTAYGTVTTLTEVSTNQFMCGSARMLYECKAGTLGLWAADKRCGYECAGTTRVYKWGLSTDQAGC